MTDTQSNQLDMYRVVLALHIAHQPVIDTVPARATAFGNLQGNVTAIDSTLALQTLVTAGITMDKKQTRIVLNDMSAVIFGIGRAWALANDDNTNAEEFNFSTSDLAHIKDDTIIAFLSRRQTIVANNAVALNDYGITPVILATWGNIMTAYTAINTAPRSAIVAVSVSTAHLKTLFNSTQNLLKVTIDPLMRLFKGNNDELYDLYTRSRIIIHRHGQGNSNTISIEGLISDVITGAPLAEVMVILGSGPDALEALTDEQGRFVIELESPEEQMQTTLTAQLLDYEIEVRDITITPYEDLEENFQLQPVPPAPPAPPVP